jgi:uncharacterized protein (TIGR02001 family)
MKLSSMAAAFVLCLSAGPACAATPGDLSVTLALTSDYRFRGISQNDRSPSPQAEIDWKNDSGWSAGVWGSTVDFQDGERTSYEVDLFAAKTFDLAGTDLSISLYYYAYPNHDSGPGGVRYSTFEGDVSASRTFDRFTLSASASWTPDSFGQNGVAWTGALGGSYELAGWLSASGHVGEQWVPAWAAVPGSGYPYAYWDAGFTATKGPASFDLRYVGTNLSPTACASTQGNRNWCGGGVVATVSFKVAL